MNTNFAISNSGLYATQIRQGVVAHDVANINTDGYEERSAIQKETLPAGTEVAAIRRTPNPDPSGPSNTDFATEATEMMANKNVYGANARVIKVQDRMLGEAIDLIR